MPTPYHAGISAFLAALSRTADTTVKRGETVLGNVTASAQVASASHSIQPIFQAVDPAIPWNWPTTGPNQISLQQFNFCDTQPESLVSGEPFVPGLNSFSQSYQTFLQLIDAATFASPKLLEKAIKAATEPAHSPSEDAGQPGWVVVPDSGQKLMFRPEWSVSLTPEQWKLELGQPFSAPVAGLAGFATGSKYASVLDAALRNATVSADSTVGVLVNPGTWYSGSLVRLAASGPFVRMDASKVVGPQGILRCRITEFLVASGLSSSATLRPADEPLLRAHLGESSEARLGPLSATMASFTATPVPDGFRATLKARPNMPFIIGALVTPVIAD